MNLQEAEGLAAELMDQHGLLDDGWYFDWDRARRRFGCCNYTRKRISLSSPLTKIREPDKVRNTILHEIAHALVGRGHGHDDVWRSKAIEIGCNGERCSNDAKIKGRWKAVCKQGHEHHRHRRPKRNTSCGICCNVYNEKYKLTYTIQEPQ